MREPAPRKFHLKDYTAPAFLISSIDPAVDMREDQALVRAALARAANATS